MAAVATQASGLDYLSHKLYYGPTTLTEPQKASTNHGLFTGFPARYDSDRVWTGADMAAKQDEWLIVLSEQDHEDITKALSHFQSLNVEPKDLSVKTFPLPQDLQRRLKGISEDCYAGRGFAVLRGLRTEEFTEAENVLVHGGISSHVASVRGYQDLKRATVTCHVISEECREGAEEQVLKPAFTNGRLAFHTDIGDILSLYMIDTAGTGGNTMIVSSSYIYNELAKLRPDLLEELGEPWVYFHAQNYEGESAPLVTNIPGDKLVLQYSRLPMTGFRKHGANATAPTPTNKRLEAMSMVEELAWKHCFPLPGKKGDMAFINNMTLMHARDAFDLDAGGSPLPSKRHLVKLMLQDPERAWDLPESLRKVWDRIYEPNVEHGSKIEKWQLTVGSNDMLPGGHIWAGNGGMSNG